MGRNPRSTIRHLAGAALLALSLAASAAELSVYSGGAVKAALDEVVAQYGAATGERATVTYMPVGTLMRSLGEGARPDVVVITADVLAAAEDQGWVVPGQAIALGGVGVGVAVNQASPAPDISTAEALKRTLLAAKSITYIDPEKGTSGKHFAEVLRRLGIAEQMKAKTRLGAAGYVVEPVARGEIELGIQQITEILPVKGVKLVGPLPEPLQKITLYMAAPTSWAGNAEAAKRFLRYLRGAEAGARFRSHGFLID